MEDNSAIAPAPKGNRYLTRDAVLKFLSDEEVARNPRSRSAKLRGVERFR